MSMDLYMKILELGLDARTWVDYIVTHSRENMQQEPSGPDLSDVAAGVQRLGEKVDELKRLLADYMPQPAPSGPRQFATLASAQLAFREDEGYPTETLLGKYYAVGTNDEGFDIQFLTKEMLERLRSDRPGWQIIELAK